MEIFWVPCAISSPFWIPVVFVAYALGRKQYTVRFLFAAMTAEAISIVAAGSALAWIMRWW